jgi:hypothetical protein
MAGKGGHLVEPSGSRAGAAGKTNPSVAARRAAPLSHGDE